MNQIVVTPAAEDAFGFSVKFCSEWLSVPGRSWPIEERKDVSFYHHLHQMGCSRKQIAVIVSLMENPLVDVCSVSCNGVVDLFPCEE